MSTKYLAKNTILKPHTSYFADVKVDISDFNENQADYQNALADQMKVRGHKLMLDKIVPLYRLESGEYAECEWYETGIITAVRFYFRFNPVILPIIALIAVFAAAAVAVGIAAVLIGVGLNVAFIPIKGILTNPVFIIGAVVVAIAIFYIVKKGKKT